MSSRTPDPTVAGAAIANIPGAYAVPDHPELMAMRIAGDAPPRPEPLARLATTRLAGMSLPRAHVALNFADGPAPALLCDRPHGEPAGHGLKPARAWSEAELIACVLRPVAAALAQLQKRDLTHRAIRPDNIFQTKPGEPVTLGPAWSRPPAIGQPAWLEPPQSATCHPSGRGDGTIADDVYALGALLVLLARGGDVPLHDAPDARIVAAKIEQGSVRAMLGAGRLPAAIAELARGMLAEDPEHRPAPTLLADPDAARARRIAARPARRAERALLWGASPVWDTRTLAHRVALDPDAGLALLADGRIERWARLALGDPGLAAAIEAVRLSREHSVLGGKAAACRLVAVLDPLAPLSWDGLRVWPDALGPLTALPAAQLGGTLADIAEADAVAIWAAARGDRGQAALARFDWRDARPALRAGEGGLLRVRYDRNPLLACQGALASHAVIGPGSLLPALDRIAAAGRARPACPLDTEAVVFAHVRAGNGLRPPARDVASPINQLTTLARFERRCPGPPTPALAAWMVAACADAIANWPGKSARERLARELAGDAAVGALAPIAEKLRNQQARSRDREHAVQAARRLRELDDGIARDRSPGTYAGAAEIGHEIAVACSALFAAIWILAAALG